MAIGLSVGLGMVPLLGRSARAASGKSVTIIGAGVAGLAASMQLASAGVPHRVIEASSRIGGRTFTQTETFGVPCDVGAHWLHNAETNPLVPFARTVNVRTYEAPEEWSLFADGEWLEGDDEEEIWDEVEDIQRAIERAVDRDLDVAVSGLVDSDASPLAQFLVGPYEHAASLSKLSTMDWDAQSEGTDFYCDGGLGALVAEWGASVAVEHGVIARKIDWSGKGIKIETNKGVIESDAVIVTVPTAVLARGDIQFTPKLPHASERAIHDLPLGSYNHIVVELDHTDFEVPVDTMLAYAGQGGTAGLLVDAGGAGLTYLDVAGDFGASLTAQGEAAMVDFARSVLVDLLGAGEVPADLNMKAFPWEAMPFAGGAYTAARPGRAGARSDLRRSVGDRVFFAGEATSLSKPATLDGAIAEGIRAARAIVG
ncbi:MAG: FAD-dependent oxidoreductase [Parvibaculum sp.]